MKRTQAFRLPQQLFSPRKFPIFPQEHVRIPLENPVPTRLELHCLSEVRFGITPFFVISANEGKMKVGIMVGRVEFDQ